MYLEKKNWFEIEEFEKLGIKALYTKKDTGNLSYYVLNNIEEVDNNRRKLYEELKIEGKKVFYSKQTHSTNIMIIEDDDEAKEYDDIDGFITKRKDTVILTQYADCLPIYYYDPKNEVMALVHAGWKGTYDGIQIKAIEIMEEKYKSKREDIVIALGIGIKDCCYEVQEDFYNKFREKYDVDLFENSFKKSGKSYYFDNEKFNALLLEKSGILKENIISSNICTYCSDKFFSYRKERDKSGRNAALIYFK